MSGIIKNVRFAQVYLLRKRNFKSHSIYRWRSPNCIYNVILKPLSDQDYGRYCCFPTVKPLITNTSEEFIKCRLGNFSMSFILY